MSNLLPLSPIFDTESVSVSTTTASATLGFASDQVLLTNAGATICFVKIGTGAVTATVAAGLPVLPGQKIVVSKDNLALTVAAITATSTTTLYATPCNGE
jgi:hypothetical protein